MIAPFRIQLFLLLAAALCPVQAAELRIGMASDVTSVDPHHQNITANNNIGWHVFDALVNVDENTRLVPGLALSWRAVDPTTWEFRLRKGVKFHDGSDFTADDAVFSLERAARVPNGQFASFVQRIVGREVVDAHTLRLKTATPYAMVPPDLNSVFIVSRRAAANAATEDFNSGRAMVGTGPFRFVRFARGDRVELARNDAYWNKEARPAWDRVTFRIMPNDPARLAALLSGDLDLIEQIPTADLARIRAHGGLRIEQKVSWRTIFFHLDQGRAQPPTIADKAGKPLAANPFRDPRVRLALSKAINRQAIVERVMDGAALPAGNLVSPPVFGHDPDLKAERFDPEGAKKLLAEAGYPAGFAFTLAAPNNRYVNDEQIAQAVAQMLARAGISARIETMPVNVYLSKARGGAFAFAMLGWGSFSGDLALRALVATADAQKGFGAWNWSRYSNPRVDALLERAFSSVDEKKREALAREAMGVAMKDLAVIPLHHQVALWAMRKGLAYTARTDEYTFAHHVRGR
ncbi:MAG: ABC transporter substrate-binding protein [Betaproteobacteria bacterium]|nr:ABC transporter substrate-binding protein [Betaproteobacteria bacterium]